MKDLPSVDSLLVALVPWINQNCTRSYLAAARGSQAFITYLPYDQRGMPPPANDPVWAMSDGGQWKAVNQYPVYAIPGNVGAILMTALSQYSGSIKSVPNEALVAEDYNSTDFVRLYATVGTSSVSSLPSLWEFLLIVLGIVIFLLFVTSAIMHYYQRRNRQALRRRVLNGEVDLEIFGIKRMMVPQEVIDKLPLYVYTSSERDPADQIPQSPEPVATSNPKVSPWRLITTPRSVSETLHLAPLPLTSASLAPSYSQPTCSICLEEFTSNQTSVRELPCHHIYHPACIDRALHKHSSLCPICKASVLPLGYCPPTITNAMVRRERRVRERAMAHTSSDEEIATTAVVAPARPLILGYRLPSFNRQFRRPMHQANRPGRRISSAPAASSMELMANNNNNNVGANGHPTALVVQQAIPPAPGQIRTEHGRRRISTFWSHNRDADEEDRERRARLPKCELSILPVHAKTTDWFWQGEKRWGVYFLGFDDREGWVNSFRSIPLVLCTLA